METSSSPRISFSADFLDEKDFISICPDSEIQKEKEKVRNPADFEFLLSNLSSDSMITADELFCEGKLLPFWQMHHCEKLNKINLKHSEEEEEMEEQRNKEESRGVDWFLDDDPSPRPPKCTVLWKELLRLRKQKASSLSPSSSTSSSSSSSLSDAPPANESKERQGDKEKPGKMKTKMKKGLERTKSATIRVRPVINVPICTQGKSTTSLPPLFPLKKGKLGK